MSPIILMLVTLVSISLADDDKCKQAKNCRECMGLGPECSWCFAVNYNDGSHGPGYRCASQDVLIQRGCTADAIEHVKSFIDPVTDVPATPAPSTRGDDIQLTPQIQSANIRPGDATTINFTFKAISDYPVDLYYLTDLSYSMKDDLETISKLTMTIAKTMLELTKKLRMGFGAFVDKPIFPFVNPAKAALQNPCENLGVKGAETCDPPFLYKHILSLTPNVSEFQEKTRITKPSGNLDSPEGGLDALLQVAYCQDEIGWDNNARKIVLFSTDGGFHVAGDGRLAGLIRPPPINCQIAYKPDRFNKSLMYMGWHESVHTDYPSVGEVARVLTDKSIGVIFATSEENRPLYESLASFLPQASVGVIQNDSSNIVALLKENYEKIIKSVDLRTDYEEDYVEVKVLTRCHKETEFKDSKICSENPIGGQIDYRILVNPKQCYNGTKKVTLQIVGLKDKAVLLVRSACDCPRCNTIQPEPASVKCNQKGQLVCGSCLCQQDYSGDFCECAAANSTTSKASMLKLCMAKDSKEHCSGRGRCRCGKCQCSQQRYRGEFCECDDQGCRRASDDNKVCGGKSRGECLCNGTCRCLPGYSNEACDCLSSNKKCEDPKDPNAPLCSGKGQCDCGVCFCNAGWTGLTCNERQGGEGVLCTNADVKHCVLCLHKMKVSDSKQGCDLECNRTAIDTARVNTVSQYSIDDGSNLCVIYDHKECRIYFTYRYPDFAYEDRKAQVHIQESSECPHKANLWVIIGSVIGGIVGIGIVLLLIWKLVVTIDDRRELAKFQKETADAKWEMEENPIYKQPVTTVTNPMYMAHAND